MSLKLGYTSAQNGRNGKPRYWRAQMIDKALRMFPHAAFATADGGVLCWDCVKAERKLVISARRECSDETQWAVIGAEVATGQRCANCYRNIEA